MNRPIRRVAVAIGALMLALLLNLNWVQVVKSDAYRNHDGNRRVILNEYSNPRGQIIVQGKAIAQSTETADQLKYLRRYPQGALYAPVTGYYSLLYGASGIEQAMNPLLAGTDRRLTAARFTDLLTGRDPRGGSITLTLNPAAQQAAFEAMGNRRGAIVALDPTTGAILAAVSTPSYDPNLLSSHDANDIAKQFKNLTSDPAQPTLNRAFSQTYPPGSVFKVIVTAAALEKGVKPSDRVAAPNVLKLPGTASATLQNFEGETCGDGRTSTLDDALTISCNTAFAQLCLDYKEAAIRDKAALFGINDEGREVPVKVAASTIGSVADQAALAQTCIGQRDVRITPLQGAMIAAAVANGGILYEPYLVAEERRPNESVLDRASPNQLGEVLSADRNQDLVQMMRHVVERGTGTEAQINRPGVVVGGKTGTADTGKVDAQGNPAEPPHAWFVGFAQQDGAARIAVAVVIENGGVSGSETTGGKAAAPAARQVIEAYLNAPNK